jgi:hypothetical protein
MSGGFITGIALSHLLNQDHLNDTVNNMLSLKCTGSGNSLFFAAAFHELKGKFSGLHEVVKG